jgi:hypothetical protein
MFDVQFQVLFFSVRNFLRAKNVVRTEPPAVRTKPPAVRTEPPSVRTEPPSVRTEPPAVCQTVTGNSATALCTSRSND